MHQHVSAVQAVCMWSRSSGKSNTFNMAKDIAQVRSATREGDTSDPLRITVSKFDKTQQHQPPPEDDTTYPSPDNRYLQVLQRPYLWRCA